MLLISGDYYLLLVAEKQGFVVIAKLIVLVGIHATAVGMVDLNSLLVALAGWFFMSIPPDHSLSCLSCFLL